jgi:hypothetical protein
MRFPRSNGLEGMVMHTRSLLLVFLLAAVVSSSHADASEPGLPAPRFALRALSGRHVDSQHLFSSRDLTFLVFWSSQCSHCVESLEGCEAFHREYGGESIQVVGVNTDDGDDLRVREVLDLTGVGFVQLADRGGAVAGEYDVPYETFAVYLVDSEGYVVARDFDAEGDVQSAMEVMLSAPRPARSITMKGKREAGVHFAGDARMRFLGVDTSGDDPVGAYGEEVSPGNDVQYRFMLGLSKRLGRMLEVGALLRLSNEGAEVLESGPDYLGSEWGSAYALVTVDRLRVRLGYYAIHMTPLTLMRWDWNDSPRIGGDTGCGCGPAAGTLLIESLEELGPSLTFEGAHISYGMPHAEIRAFYAIPRRARTTDYTSYRFSGESAHYSLEIYGAEARLQRRDGRTGRFWRAGLHFIGSCENKHTVDFRALGYPVSAFWYESMTLSASWEVPLLEFAALRGEWLVSNGGEQHDPDASAGEGTYEYNGGGGTAGLLMEREGLYELTCDYLRTEPGFFSPFAALSYEPNREGVRAGGSLYLLGGRTAVSVFYKRAREIDSYVQDGEKEQLSLFGLSLDLELESGFGGYIGYFDRGSWRTGEMDRFDAVRQAFSAGVRYRFETSAYCELRYERVDTSSDETGISLESETDLFALYLKAEF